MYLPPRGLVREIETRRREIGRARRHERPPRARLERRCRAPAAFIGSVRACRSGVCTARRMTARYVATRAATMHALTSARAFASSAPALRPAPARRRRPAASSSSARARPPGGSSVGSRAVLPRPSAAPPSSRPRPTLGCIASVHRPRRSRWSRFPGRSWFPGGRDPPRIPRRSRVQPREAPPSTVHRVPARVHRRPPNPGGRRRGPHVSPREGQANMFLDGNPIVYGAPRTSPPATRRPTGRRRRHAGAAVAWGCYNPHSMYRVRILQMAWEIETAEAPNGKPGVRCDVGRYGGARVRERIDFAPTRGPRGIETHERVPSDQLRGDRLSGVCVDMYGDVAVASVSAAWANAARADISAVHKTNAARGVRIDRKFSRAREDDEDDEDGEDEDDVVTDAHATRWYDASTGKDVRVRRRGRRRRRALQGDGDSRERRGARRRSAATRLGSTSTSATTARSYAISPPVAIW